MTDKGQDLVQRVNLLLHAAHMIGDGLRSRTNERQATEVVHVAVHTLDRMLELRRPISVRTA